MIVIILAHNCPGFRWQRFSVCTTDSVRLSQTGTRETCYSKPCKISFRLFWKLRHQSPAHRQIFIDPPPIQASIFLLKPTLCHQCISSHEESRGSPMQNPRYTDVRSKSDGYLKQIEDSISAPPMIYVIKTYLYR